MLIGIGDIKCGGKKEDPVDQVETEKTFYIF